MFITPAVAGNAVYIGSCSGRYFALDTATGAQRWAYDTSADGPAVEFHGDALVTDDLVVVGGDAEPTASLYAFEPASGRITWKLAAPGGVAAQVLGRDQVVYAQVAGGEVWALDQHTGKRVWVHQAVSPGAASWRQVDPALAGDRLVVGWPTGDVEALSATTGALLWRTATGSRLNTSLVIVDGQVLVGAMDGRLHRLALADGQATAPVALGGTPYGDLVVTDRCVLVLSMGDGYRLACRKHDGGNLLWERRFTAEITTFRPLPWGDEVVIGSTGQLVGLRLHDGADAWSCAITGVPRGTSATAERLYLGTLGGMVMALPRAAIEQCGRSPAPSPTPAGQRHR